MSNTPQYAASLTGIEKITVTEDGQFVTITVNTSTGEKALLDVHWQGLGAIVSHLQNAADVAGKRRGRVTIEPPDNAFVVTDFALGEMQDRQDVILSLLADHLRFDFAIPKGLARSNGENLLEALSTALVLSKTSPHTGH